MGFTSQLRCPHCQSRYQAKPIILHGGALQCRSCSRICYALMVQNVNLYFLVEVTHAEVVAMASQGLTVLDVLKRLGAGVEAA